MRRGRAAMGLEKPVIAKSLLCVIEAVLTWGLLVSASAGTAALTLVGSREHGFSSGVCASPGT